MSTVLITGASAGLGVEFARLFAREGHHLVLVARRAQALEALAAELRAQHGTACTLVAVDLSRREAPAEVADRVGAAGLDVDVLVNNAGYGVFGPFAQQDEAALLGIVHVNIAAVTHLTRLLLPGMIRRRTGGILNVASVAGFLPGPLMAVYYASKAYLVSFSEALAEELRGTGVTVTLLCPGPTRTEFQEAAGLGSSRLVDMSMMEAAAVAEAGHAGLRAGRRLVIPGARNRLIVLGSRFAPAGLLSRIVRRAQERRIPAH